MEINDITILVNKENLLDEHFIPNDLVVVNEPMGVKLDQTYVNMVRSEVYQNFKLMQADALMEGHYIFIDSSYRPYSYQVRLLDNLIEVKGTDGKTYQVTYTN